MKRGIWNCGLAVVLSLGASLASVEAKQYHKIVHGKEVVVHTNPIPVVMHRMVPPQLGRHITEKELHTCSIPSEGRLFKLKGK